MSGYTIFESPKSLSPNPELLPLNHSGGSISNSGNAFPPIAPPTAPAEGLYLLKVRY